MVGDVLEPSLPIPKGHDTVINKSAAKGQDDEPGGNKRSQNGEDGEAVQRRLEGVVAGEGLCGEPDLHGGQDNSDVDYRPG